MAASLRRIFSLLLRLLRGLLPVGSFAQQQPAQQSSAQQSTVQQSPTQQPSPAPPGSLQLTLKQAVQLALKQNPQRVIARC